jgi:hypothetical protein
MAVFVPVVAILIVILIIGWAVTLFYKKFIKKSDAENNLME